MKHWKLSEKTKEKMHISAKKRGFSFGTGFKKGNKINKGKKYSEERKKKIGEANSCEKIEIKCKNCLKSRFILPCELFKRKFCSLKCFHLYSKGKNSPHWKGGLTSLRESIKMSIPYRKWRILIMKRDKFTCCLCNRSKEVTGKLQVDHFPKSYAEIIFENKIDTLEKALSCKELWEQNNGRTICEDCHKKTDSWGGKNVTKMKRIYGNLYINYETIISKK